jgi:hypothetical protein
MFCKTDEFDEAHRALAPLGCGNSAKLQCELDIAEHVAPGQEIDRLKHHSPVRPGSGNLSSFNLDSAAIGLCQPRDDAQQCRLAGAARTDNADKFVFPNREIDVFQNIHGAHTVR